MSSVWPAAEVDEGRGAVEAPVAAAVEGRVSRLVAAADEAGSTAGAEETAADDSLAMMEESVANMSVVVVGSAGEDDASGRAALAEGTSVPMEKTSDWQ